MTDGQQWKILDISTAGELTDAALEVFEYQYINNQIYKEFADHLGKHPGKVRSLDEIPYLPVEFFRKYSIISGKGQHEIIFGSSGTTGTKPSRHYVTDLSLYEASFVRSFSRFYGDPHDYILIALLPSYTEREGSSLVYMADSLIRLTGHPLSGFYMGQHGSVTSAIKQSKEQGRKIILLGVSFALLDLAEKEAPDLSGVIVMETGGMKGRRKEIIREELHNILKEKFRVGAIHSEYGMTELLSQAYSSGEGLFRCPPWMKILVRDPHDPLSVYTETGLTGGVNIVDLANINSCSFLSTGDLGKINDSGTFEILGRFDSSDIRGCNLMVE